MNDPTAAPTTETISLTAEPCELEPQAEAPTNAESKNSSTSELSETSRDVMESQPELHSESHYTSASQGRTDRRTSGSVFVVEGGKIVPEPPSRSSSLEPVQEHDGNLPELPLPSEEEKQQMNNDMMNTLCEMESGFAVMVERIKQSSISARDAGLFLKKRAQLEEQYARELVKLASSQLELHNDSKKGTFDQSWVSFVRIHEAVGHARIKFAASINEAAEGLGNTSKDSEKIRKTVRENGMKIEKQLVDQEIALDKAKQKYNQCSEEWEKALLQRGHVDAKQPPPPPPLPAAGIKNFFRAQKTADQLIRIEEDAKHKASIANEAYKVQLTQTNQGRQKYFGYDLPKFLRSLLEKASETDAALKYHLARYAYQWETAVTAEGNAVLPTPQLGRVGVRMSIEQMDLMADLQRFLEDHRNTTGKQSAVTSMPLSNLPMMPRRSLESVGELSYEAYSMKPQAQRLANPKNIFGVDLILQLRRDNLEIPVILDKCAKYIEAKGMEAQGIYRMSGLQQKVKSLRQSFDADYLTVDLEQDEFASDVHAVAGVLKLYFRELPSPLIPGALHADLIAAARNLPL